MKCALLIFVAAVMQASAVPARQAGPVPTRESAFLEANLSEFEVHKQTLLEALLKLARGPAPFGFGFEKILKEKLSDPEIPDPALSLELQNKSVREILDALCQADQRYTWSVDGTTVDVYPRAVTSDKSYLLNRELPKLELKNATDVQDGLLAISRQLPPPKEQIAIAQAGGADPYPPDPWTVTFENVTVRKVVNRLTEHGGRCGYWIFGGARDFRAFGFFNTYLCDKTLPAWFPKRAGPPGEHPRN